MSALQVPTSPPKLPGSPSKAGRASDGAPATGKLHRAGPHFPWLALGLGALSAVCCGLAFWLFFATSGVSSQYVLFVC